MRIPWMVTARAVKWSKLCGTDVAGIFDRFTVDSFPASFPFTVLAKIEPEPVDVSRGDLVLQIFNSGQQCIYERQLPNTQPTYQEWLDGADIYIRVVFDMEVNQPDEFRLLLGTTEQVLAEERMTVALKGVGR